MENINISFDGMISKLDTACGMLLVQSMKDKTVRKAMELVTDVSISLGEWVSENGLTEESDD